MEEARAIGLKMDFDDEAPGIRYEIEGPGFGLPYHTHATRDEYHDVECIYGEVIVYGYDWVKVMKPGDVFTQFDCSLPHAISSRGAAIWFNRYWSRPSSWSQMREDEKHTVLNSRLDLPDWVLNQLTPE